MLALVAALAFALFSMAALTVDLGLAAAEQNRLEVAAEAAALGMLKEQARLEHELALGRLSEDDLRCAATVPACIQQLASVRGERLAREVLGSPASTQGAPAGEIPLELGELRLRLESCGTDCGQAYLDRAIPLFFGQASLIGFEGSSLRDLQETRNQGKLLVGDGLPAKGALRAKGIPIGSRVRAEAFPVVRVGLREEASGLPGRAPFALRLDAWRSLGDESPPLELQAEELLLGPEVVGRLVNASAGLVAGAPLGPLEPDVPIPAQDLEGSYLAYVPLTVNEIVVGFGYARLEFGLPNQFVVRPLGNRLAPGNATASPRFLAGSTNIPIVVAAQREDSLLQQSAFLRTAVVR